MEPQQVAAKYLGKTEKPGNAGFNDAVFEKKMQQVGFQKGHAWCSYFAELCFKEAFPQMHDELDKLFSASAVQTFRNFSNAGYKITKQPFVGALIVWQRYKDGQPHWSGHVGIVSEVLNPRQFVSIEGNTNDKGGREGYIVASHMRTSISSNPNSLRPMGFIEIKPKTSA